MKTNVTWLRKSEIKPPTPNGYNSFGQGFERGDVRRVMSRSQLIEFGKNPHRWKLGYKDGDTDATDWGSLVDTLLLVPKQFDSLYAVAPETYMAKGKKKGDPEVEKPWNWNATFCDEWREKVRAEGKIPLKKSDYLEALDAVAVLKRSKASEILAESDTQVVIVVEYVDDDTGLVVPIKCAIDIAPNPESQWGSMLLDLKTTESSSVSSWTKHVFNFGYEAQGALYLDAYNVANDLSYEQFGHIVQESFPPYEVAKRMLSEDFIRLGRARYRRLLADYCHCLKHDWWPGHDEYQSSNGKVTQIDGWTVVEPEPWMELV